MPKADSITTTTETDGAAAALLADPRVFAGLRGFAERIERGVLEDMIVAQRRPNDRHRASAEEAVCEMIAEPSTGHGVEDETADLLAAAGLLSIAIEGHPALRDGVDDWDLEAMRYGARQVHALAERLVARLERRPTRFMVPIIGMMEPAEEGGAEKAA